MGEGSKRRATCSTVGTAVAAALDPPAETRCITGSYPVALFSFGEEAVSLVF